LRTSPKIGVRAHPDITRVTMYDGPPGAHAVLLLGLSSTSFAGFELPLSLSRLGFRGCSLLTSIEASVLTLTGSDGIAKGYASVVLPGIPAMQGSLVHAQWLVLGEGDRAPGGLSDAALWRVP
jgi:hypothetical protein